MQLYKIDPETLHATPLAWVPGLPIQDLWPIVRDWSGEPSMESEGHGLSVLAQFALDPDISEEVRYALLSAIPGIVWQARGAAKVAASWRTAAPVAIGIRICAEALETVAARLPADTWMAIGGHDPGDAWQLTKTVDLEDTYAKAAAAAAARREELSAIREQMALPMQSLDRFDETPRRPGPKPLFTEIFSINGEQAREIAGLLLAGDGALTQVDHRGVYVWFTARAGALPGVWRVYGRCCCYVDGQWHALEMTPPEKDVITAWIADTGRRFATELLRASMPSDA